METSKTFRVCYLALIFLTIWATSQSKHCVFRDPLTKKLCIMVDVNFTAEIQAAKEGTVVATKNVTSEDESVDCVGYCGTRDRTLLVRFTEKTFWSVSFTRPGEGIYTVQQSRSFVFEPKDLFGESMSGISRQVFYDPRPVYQKNIQGSYLCTVPDQVNYYDLNITMPSDKVDFQVNVNVLSIQSQGYNLDGEKYGPAEKCSSA
ncbi:hypothetical protein PoB_005980900 [Plakobranchus ocellatus]|uniref:Uncharacterized protein n=1 Tax=Plakobranchus ocellatus TaxID=259542 RepID=A0AAV4CKB8_9GAST|nr:hypothetical protein PoB_005980900 [Plakobranchus ocellatus]